MVFREMLDEFEHYLFLFHDEFVEVVAGGVWLLSAGERAGLQRDHASEPRATGANPVHLAPHCVVSRGQDYHDDDEAAAMTERD